MATYASIKYDMDLSSNATGAGALTLLSTQTASSSATISFTSNIDSTYKEYIFKFIDVHPATDQADLQVNFRDGGSSYDATKTSTNVQAYHGEGDEGGVVAYDDGRDLAQSTAVLNIARMIGNGNDESGYGTLHLYDPSNTTFVKHFILDTQCYNEGDYSVRRLIAGYCNTTSAIDGVQFSFSSGNIDAGTFKLYGVS
tara:strand:+ start:713 stop:1306 length:594 start_codon:yes stop_codon:yes gene_type:complete